VIPEDWEERKLGSVCKLINGRGFKPYEWKDSGLPIIRIQNLNGSDDFNYFDGHYAKKLEIEPKQLLFAWSGSRGTSFGPHIWNGPLGLLNYHTWKVQVDQRTISEKFFLHALKQLTKFIEEQAHGAAALVHVQKWEMETFKFPLPPTKAEQEAIAGALSDADAWIESLEQLIAKKRRIKEGAMQTLLSGKKRLPGFSGEWEVKALGEIAKIVRGASPRPIEDPVWFDHNSPVGWVRISDVTKSGIYLEETTQKLSQQGIEHSRPVASGNLIMSICATVGRPIITRINVCIHDGFVVFENLKANQRFIYYILKAIEPKWSEHGQTGSQMNLNTALINGTIISLPDGAEQTAIAKILSDMDTEIDASEAKLSKARQIKQGMMQELLTGKTRLV
jgi:type I restriction enzyme S subunit